MKTVQVPPIRWNRSQRPEITERLQSVRVNAPALRQFASKQTHDRPFLVAGSLIALGLIPMAAFASRRMLTRGHAPAAAHLLPRNQEWYVEDDEFTAPTMALPRNQEWYVGE
jgi:hypothetical protein